MLTCIFNLSLGDVIRDYVEPWYFQLYDKEDDALPIMIKTIFWEIVDNTKERPVEMPPPARAPRIRLSFSLSLSLFFLTHPFRCRRAHNVDDVIASRLLNIDFLTYLTKDAMQVTLHCIIASLHHCTIAPLHHCHH